MVVANQENRENVSEYGIGISLISYQNTTFKPLTQEQTTLVSEKLDAAAEKAELIAEEGNGYYVFYKSTCPYCKVGLTSLLEKLPEERKKDLLFIDLDNIDAKKIADSFGVDKAGTVVSVVKDKETGNYKIMKDTIAFDDEKGDIVANNQLIDKMVTKEEV
jgi:thioredoxin